MLLCNISVDFAKRLLSTQKGISVFYDQTQTDKLDVETRNLLFKARAMVLREMTNFVYMLPLNLKQLMGYFTSIGGISIK